LAGAKSRVQCQVDGGVSEPEASVCELFGDGPRAGEKGRIGHFAERNAQGKGRCGKNGGAMKSVCKSVREFSIRYRVGSREVYWAGQPGIVQSK
jgi:hypothetical protein